MGFHTHFNQKSNNYEEEASVLPIAPIGEEEEHHSHTSPAVPIAVPAIQGSNHSESHNEGSGAGAELPIAPVGHQEDHGHVNPDEPIAAPAVQAASNQPETHNGVGGEGGDGDTENELPIAPVGEEEHHAHNNPEEPVAAPVALVGNSHEDHHNSVGGEGGDGDVKNELPIAPVGEEEHHTHTNPDEPIAAPAIQASSHSEAHNEGSGTGAELPIAPVGEETHHHEHDHGTWIVETDVCAYVDTAMVVGPSLLDTLFSNGTWPIIWTPPEGYNPADHIFTEAEHVTVAHNGEKLVIEFKDGFPPGHDNTPIIIPVEWIDPLMNDHTHAGGDKIDLAGLETHIDGNRLVIEWDDHHTSCGIDQYCPGGDSHSDEAHQVEYVSPDYVAIALQDHVEHEHLDIVGQGPVVPHVAAFG